MESPLYRKIADSIRLEILEGRLKPGDQLPTIRELTEQWGCTQGTIQRAYQELAREGLVTSRAGLGTRVASMPTSRADVPLRRTALIHKAESYILEAVNSGFTPAEIEQAFQHAIDRFRVAEAEPVGHSESELRFLGSHDLAVTRITTRFEVFNPSVKISLIFSGSLGGLIALEEGKADLAGCHLWDAETASYNVPFVRRLLPGRRVTLLTLAERSLGLILPPGNPLSIHGLEDLAKPGVKFVNRQAGSGTRVWLDHQLRSIGVKTAKIDGYDQERSTHSEVAQMIAEGGANAGIGLEASARSLGLDFIPLTLESYQLAALTENAQKGALKKLFQWIGSVEAKKIISSLPGYLTFRTGEIQVIE
jgi:molybdate-binding protein/DNA-binding transcriptional regulator YhcF (GntR family)